MTSRFPPFAFVELVSRVAFVVYIPKRTFLVRFGVISGEFGRAMVRILARRSRAKKTHGETKRA